jgi:rRNA-processing protein FCF1
MAFRNNVALDTNFLLYAAQSKLDVFAQFRQLLGSKVSFVIPYQVEHELEKISGRKGKFARNVKLVLIFMKSYNVSSKKISARNADAALLKMAKSGYLVATNDRELKRRINLASEKVAYLRQKKYIEIG